MMKDQCISVTKLRTHTKECLQGLEIEPKFIFVNNSPVAVLMDIQTYEEEFIKPELIELSEDEVTPAMKRAVARARKLKREDLINI